MLIQLIPFEGELDQGYLGREMRLNSCLKESEIDQMIAQHAQRFFRRIYSVFARQTCTV